MAIEIQNICKATLLAVILLRVTALVTFRGTVLSHLVSFSPKKHGPRSQETSESWHMAGIAPGAHVDLFPWEVSSHMMQECKPPHLIPSYCCIGSSSSGGSQNFVRNHTCGNRSMVDDYGLAKKLATEYLEQHPVEGLQCDVCQIVNLMIHYNLTMSFQGDSVSLQTYNGFECELRRRGYTVETAFAPYAKRNKTAFWKYGLRDTRNLTVTRPSETMRRQAKFAFYAMYRPYEDNKEIQSIARESEIVVFDHGLHWVPNQSDQFKNAMVTLLRGYSCNETKGDNKLKLLAWRETSAQHYGSPTGDYSFGMNAYTECLPTRNISRDSQPFRTQLMMEAAEIAGFVVSNASDASFLSQAASNLDELVVLPYYRFTSKLHRLHPTECTHFCHTPYVWLPIWRTLRLSLDRAIKQFQTRAQGRQSSEQAKQRL